MPFVVEPDDDVWRFQSVWLGPPGYTLPFHVRYVAYVLGASIYVGIILIEAVLPVVSVSTPPFYELLVTLLVTALIMNAVDHDKPLAAAVQTTVGALRSPGKPRDVTHHAHPHLGSIVKFTKDPIT